MSYNLRATDDGAIIFLPIEIPLYDGDIAELCKQATIALSSAERHLAVFEYISGIATENDIEMIEEADEEYKNAEDQLISCLMSLAGIIDGLGMPIEQRIMETL